MAINARGGASSPRVFNGDRGHFDAKAMTATCNDASISLAAQGSILKEMALPDKAYMSDQMLTDGLCNDKGPESLNAKVNNNISPVVSPKPPDAAAPKTKVRASPPVENSLIRATPRQPIPVTRNASPRDCYATGFLNTGARVARAPPSPARARTHLF